MSRDPHRHSFLVLLLAVLAMSGCAESRSTPTPESSEPAEAPPSPVTFVDATAAAGLAAFRHENAAAGDKWFPEQMGGGGGFIDYDGDGWLDILLVGGGVWPAQAGQAPLALWLYRNNQDGTFALKTEEAGLGGLAVFSIGIAVADYDNDGDEDFYLTTLYENLLFRNDGGTFTEVGRASGVADEAVWSSSPIFFDADRDGNLDLYVANYARWSVDEDVWCTLDGQTKEYCSPNVYSGLPSRYYHNNGDGTFTEATKAAGFWPAEGKSLGVVELDFNHDGWPDLAVANDGEGDLLYRNDGDGTFTEVGVQSGFAFSENGEARAGMGIDAGVVDQTGEPTIFVGNFSHEMVGVYRHGGNGWFLDRAAVSKIGHPTLLKLTFGLFLFDVDFDRDLDLFIGNGHVYPTVEATEDNVTYRQPSQLFINRGDGTFDERGTAFGDVFATPMVVRGAAYADYDRDGDLDILLTENGGPVRLWRNDIARADASGRGSAGSTPSFLRVRLQGTESNRDAVGASLVAVVGEERMYRQIRTGSSYLSQLEKIATFGLGVAARVDSLTVAWPSGRIDRFGPIPGNQEIRIVEGAGTFEPVPLPNYEASALAQRK